MSLVLLFRSAAGSSNGTATVTGVQATASLGNESSSGTAVVAETGLQGTTSLGTVIGRGNASKSVTGNQAVASLGNESSSGTATIAETGLQATTSLGTVTATGETGSGSATATVTGVSATSALGSVTATGEGAPPVVNTGGGSSRITHRTITGYTEPRLSAVAHADGVEAEARIGQIHARGTAIAGVLPFPPMQATLGEVSAFGAKNLPENEILFLLLEAA